MIADATIGGKNGIQRIEGNLFSLNVRELMRTDYGTDYGEHVVAHRVGLLHCFCGNKRRLTIDNAGFNLYGLGIACEDVRDVERFGVHCCTKVGHLRVKVTVRT